MKSYLLVLFALAGSSAVYSQTPAPGAPLTGPQNAAVGAMNTLLQSQAAAVTAARTALAQAAFSNGGAAAIRTQVDALAAAETALALARANTLAMIQSSPNKLSA